MTDHERYLFDLQGFLLVEDALAAEEVAMLDALVDAQIAERVPPEANTHRFGRLLEWGEPYRSLVYNPRITPYLADLLGARFRLDHDYADVIRSGKGPIGTTLHGGATPFDPSQYYHFRDGRLHNGLTVVAYCLRDVNPGDGGFACVPGSHKSNLRFPDDWRNLEQPHPCVQAVTGKAGSAIIFTEALTHGTLPWHGAGERRTVFYKYCPHPLAWSRRYYADAEAEALPAEDRHVLATPGVYPDPRGQKRDGY